MYCTPQELTQYVFQKYLDKIEALEPGMVATHIAGVCAEIDDALRPRFCLPLNTPPETICRIARVMAAFRCIGAITSIMDTEGTSNNVWLPLQTQYKEAVKQLAAIAEGALDVGLEALGNEAENSPTQGMLASSGPQKFNVGFWRKY